MATSNNVTSNNVRQPDAPPLSREAHRRHRDAVYRSRGVAALAAVGFAEPSAADEPAVRELARGRAAHARDTVNEIEASLRREADQAEFDRLMAEWIQGTRVTSSMTKMISHPAYQQIVAMGERAVRPILRDLEKEPRPWGSALHRITGAQPVPPEDAGRAAGVARAWLRWAREMGYRW